MAAPTLSDLNAAAMAYARVSRAVRQTVMLQTRLLEGPQGEARKAGAAAADRTSELKDRIKRILRRAVDETPGEGENAERLYAEALERLEQERFSDDDDERPVVEIVTDICRALGLKPDFKRLCDELNAADAFAAGPPKKGEWKGPKEIYWIGQDGYPVLASEICGPRTGRWWKEPAGDDGELAEDTS
jgi:hypothetical protein